MMSGRSRYVDQSTPVNRMFLSTSDRLDRDVDRLRFVLTYVINRFAEFPDVRNRGILWPRPSGLSSPFHIAPAEIVSLVEFQGRRRFLQRFNRDHSESSRNRI